MALDFYSTLDQLLNPTHDLGGGPGGDPRAIAQLILGGGSAGLEGQTLFGQPPTATDAPLGPGVLGVSNPAINQSGVVQAPGRALPGSLQEVLRAAKEMSENLSPGSTSERKTFVGNPYGPGSYDPSNPAERQAVLEQGKKVTEVNRAKELLSSPALLNLPAAAQGEIVKSLLRQMGIGDDEVTSAFNKAFAGARGKALGEGKVEEPLGIDKASKLYRYNTESRALEIAPPNITDSDAQKQGFRILPPKLIEKASEVRAVRPALAALQAAVEGAAESDPLSLKASQLSGGFIGGQEGSILDTAQRDFAFQFDKLLGGVRGAASPQLFQAMKNRLPRILQTPELRARSLQLMEGIVEVLEDENYRAAFGLPMNKGAIEKAREAATTVINSTKEAKSASGRVRVVSPDGVSGSIPAGQLEEALGAGFTRQ